MPRKIFELGLQSFEAVAEYVLTYAEYLWGLGDYDNMRALFERALAADSKTKKLWDRYIQVSLQHAILSHARASSIQCRFSWSMSQVHPLGNPCRSTLELKWFEGHML